MAAPNGIHAAVVVGALAGLVLAGCANAVVVHVTPPPANQVEVVRVDQPPPGSTDDMGSVTASASSDAGHDRGQTQPWACLQP